MTSKLKLEKELKKASIISIGLHQKPKVGGSKAPEEVP